MSDLYINCINGIYVLSWFRVRISPEVYNYWISKFNHDLNKSLMRIFIWIVDQAWKFISLSVSIYRNTEMYEYSSKTSIRAGINQLRRKENLTQLHVYADNKTRKIFSGVKLSNSMCHNKQGKWVRDSNVVCEFMSFPIWHNEIIETSSYCAVDGIFNRYSEKMNSVAVWIIYISKTLTCSIKINLYL